MEKIHIRVKHPGSATLGGAGFVGDYIRYGTGTVYSHNFVVLATLSVNFRLISRVGSVFEILLGFGSIGSRSVFATLTFSVLLLQFYFSQGESF
jgi:hypothetical protein